MARNLRHENEVVVANSDKSIQLIDVEKGEIASFDDKTKHRGKIESLCYSGMRGEYGNPESCQSTILSASEDKFVKLWDRNSGQCVAKLQSGGLPFYSVDTN